MALESRVGVGEQLLVKMEDCVPMVKVPLSLLVEVLAALSDNVHLRTKTVQEIVREMKSYVNG